MVMASEIAGHLMTPFQNESSCKKIDMKMTLIKMKLKMLVDRNTFSYEYFRKKTRFHTDAKGNLEMSH